MDWINHDELTNLCQQRSGVHISMFMPLERESDKREANRIRLKNLIKQGRQQLAAEELPANVTLQDGQQEQFFQPAEALLQDGRFLPENDKNSQGLVIFLSAEMHQIYYVPLKLEESVVVGPRFYIRPLLPLLGDDGRFYLLQLSQNEVKLWHGTQFDLEAVEVPDLPTSMSDALALEDPERELQFHTSTQPGRRDRPATFHGHDTEREKSGAILRFCREVSQAVETQIKGEEAPLLLASVDYLLPIYEQVNTYPHLLNEAVSGNPDHLKPFELRERAWPIVQQHYSQAKEAAISQYEQFGGTENTSQQMQEIVPAAAYGRVETLFVAQEQAAQWGRFVPDSGEVELCAAKEAACEDLLNVAAAHTLLHGGTSYVIPEEEMPNGAQMAAIFRYSV